MPQYYNVVCDDPDFLVINKYQGIAVQKEQGCDISLLDIIKHDLNLPELYLCHRLDKMTSGVMVLAKNTAANRQISMAFEQKRVEKKYIALSIHKPKKKQGCVRGDMQKARRGAFKLLRTSENPAMTYFTSAFIEPNLRFFMITPLTGKTHQIRVALKSIGSPILGDTLYEPQNEAITSDRGYLHALSIHFPFHDVNRQFSAHPIEGKYFQLPEVKSLIADFSEQPAKQLK